MREPFFLPWFLTTAEEESAEHGLQSQTYPSMKRNLALSASSLSSYLDKSIYFFFSVASNRQETNRRSKAEARSMYNIYLRIYLLLSSKATGPLSWQRPQTGQQKQSKGWHRWGREAAAGMVCQPGQTLFSRYLLHFLLKKNI